MGTFKNKKMTSREKSMARQAEKSGEKLGNKAIKTGALRKSPNKTTG